MGTDTDTKDSSPSEIKPLEEFNPDQDQFQELDERDMIEPLNEAPDETDDPQTDGETEPPIDIDAGEQEITIKDADEKVGDDPDSDEIDIDIKARGEGIEEPIEPDDPPEPNPDGTADATAETPGDPEMEPDDPPDPNPDGTADATAETPGDPDGDIGENSDDVSPEDEPVGDGESSEETDPSAADPENEDGENDFVALTDDDVGDGAEKKPIEEEPPAETADAQKDNVRNEDEKNVSQSKPPDEIKKTDAKEITPLKTTADVQKAKAPAKGMSTARKIIASAIIILIIAGYTIYNKPGVVGLEGEQEPSRAVQTETQAPAEPVEVQVQKPKPIGKQQRYLAKIEEVNQLREKLLAKKEEIYRLKLHYRNGIVDLQGQISREMQETGISSLSQALNNKRIELDLRTIQRRQNYIQELEKPDQWTHNGSEELLYLRRKAELDLQMADVASGIDLDRHLRYINAAIQKYQPSAEKLAIDPLPVELTPLESIWAQIIHQQADKARTPVNPEDEKIITEICSGDFKRIAELSAITTKAARCLASMSGSDLFLNGLTQVSPEEAKYLFQWRGNWICLNSIKELSPAAARYLFKWEGSWISLNGLTEFPPELAVYLMEWKGNQLELMGLNYDKANPDRKVFKYLALWETMGGKLFVSDAVRKEMKQTM